VPSRFTGDRDVLVAFKKFQIACQVSCQKATQPADTQPITDGAVEAD
jgi:hypothetical protein